MQGGRRRRRRESKKSGERQKAGKGKGRKMTIMRKRRTRRFVRPISIRRSSRGNATAGEAVVQTDGEQLESCMATARYKSVTAKITAYDDNEFRYSTEQVFFLMESRSWLRGRESVFCLFANDEERNALIIRKLRARQV